MPGLEFRAIFAQRLLMELGQPLGKPCERHRDGVDLNLQVAAIRVRQVVLPRQQQPRLAPRILPNSASTIHLLGKVQQPAQPRVRLPDRREVPEQPGHVAGHPVHEPAEDRRQGEQFLHAALRHERGKQRHRRDLGERRWRAVEEDEAQPVGSHPRRPAHGPKPRHVGGDRPDHPRGEAAAHLELLVALLVSAAKRAIARWVTEDPLQSLRLRNLLKAGWQLAVLPHLVQSIPVDLPTAGRRPLLHAHDSVRRQVRRPTARHGEHERPGAARAHVGDQLRRRSLLEDHSSALHTIHGRQHIFHGAEVDPPAAHCDAARGPAEVLELAVRAATHEVARPVDAHARAPRGIEELAGGDLGPVHVALRHLPASYHQLASHIVGL
mmetsp:Transcript_58842/g.190508  ORF Transcript_58842/g.190508 Transcript_58842/m.190508 type:complete len:381 (+) Transcript_58842:2156-3298(+)